MVPQKFEIAAIFSRKKVLRGRVTDNVPNRQFYALIFTHLGTENKESARTLKIFDLWFFIFPFSYLTLHPRF